MPQDGSQRAGKGETDFVIDRALNEPFDFVLDRVFGGDDFLGDFVEKTESGIQGGGFARTGGPGHQDDAVRFLNDFAERDKYLGVHPDLVEVEFDSGAVEHPDNNAFAEHGGQHRDAKVHLVATHVKLDASVLWQTAFGDVEIRHDLDTAADG